MKNLIALALLMVGMQGHANTMDIQVNGLLSSMAPKAVKPMAMLNWKVNDACEYTLKGGMLNGSLKMFVREEVSQGFWVQQDVDLGFLGQQKIEALYDKNNGDVIEMRVNGEKQDIPSRDGIEVVESRRENVTVPKGTFDSIYLKLRDKKDNKETQMWVNPSQISIAGMLKTIQASQMGEITVELVDFLKQ